MIKENIKRNIFLYFNIANIEHSWRVRKYHLKRNALKKIRRSYIKVI